MPREPARHVISQPEDDAQASDRVLLRQAGMGSATAYEELFHRHFTGTFSYALRMLNGDDALAQDATQEAWSKVWTKGLTFRGESKVRTWLFTIVAHEVTELRRKRRPVVIAPEVLAQIETDQARIDGVNQQQLGGIESKSAELVALDRNLWESLALALSELPWRQRAVWLLREHHGMSYDDIAEVLVTTNAVVRGQLHRARRALAIRMEEWR